MLLLEKSYVFLLSKMFLHFDDDCAVKWHIAVGVGCFLTLK